MPTKDFQQRNEELTDRLAKLTKDYEALMAEIKSDGQHYTGYRKLKETYFRLASLTKRNGVMPERRTVSRPPNHAQFNRAVPNRATKREAGPAPEDKPGPRTDLFTRKARPAAEADAEPTAQNKQPNNAIFQRKAQPAPAEPKPSRTKEAAPEKQGKVLASSSTATERKRKKSDDDE